MSSTHQSYCLSTNGDASIDVDTSSDCYTLLQNVQYEEELASISLVFHNAETYGVDVDANVTDDKYEEQRPGNECRGGTLPRNTADLEKTWSQNEIDPRIKAKSERVESEDCGSGETRHWVVCERGVLKEIKVEPTDTRETSTCNQNVLKEIKLEPPDRRPDTYETSTHSGKNTLHEMSRTDANPYKCAACGDSFKNSIQLTAHQKSNLVTCGESFRNSDACSVRERTRTNVKPYTCLTCGHYFKAENYLAALEKTLSGLNPSVCITCGVLRQTEAGDCHSAANETCLDGVRREKTGQKQHCNVSYADVRDTQPDAAPRCEVQPAPLPVDDTPRTHFCSACGLSFVDSVEFAFHVEQHQRRKVCATCAKLFEWSTDLKRHEMVHPGDKPFTCDTCSKSFTWTTSFIYREKVRVSTKPWLKRGISIPRYTCNICRKTFNGFGSLKAHDRIHTGEKPYVCSTCGMSFAHSTGLKGHEKTHLPVTRYRCVTCDKSYMTHTRLNTHERSHTGVEPYTCRICDKVYDRLSSLAEHEPIHFGAERFRCDICGRSFMHLPSLKVHEISHSSDKPHACPTCGKLFLFAGNFRKHKMGHTGFV